MKTQFTFERITSHVFGNII